MSGNHIDTVKAMYAAFQRGDIGSIIDATSGAVDWHTYGDPAHFPTLLAVKGHAGVEQFFKTVGENLEFSAFTPQEFLASSDSVVVLGHYTAKVKKTGKTASSHWAHIFTFKDGKVVRFREYADTAAFATAYR